MRKVRFTEEQMVAIMREADREPVAVVAKRHGISEQTIYFWRATKRAAEPLWVRLSFSMLSSQRCVSDVVGSTAPSVGRCARQRGGAQQWRHRDL